MKSESYRATTVPVPSTDTSMITYGLLPILSALAIGAATLAVSPAVHAGGDQEVARELRAKGKILPLEQILKKAMVHRAGTVIEAEFEIEGSRFVYELEILDSNGVVWELEFDASTGELLKLERD